MEVYFSIFLNYANPDSQCHRRMLIVMLNNLAQTLKIRVNLVAMLVMFLFMMHTGNEQLENVVLTIPRNVYVKHVTAELSGAVGVIGAEFAPDFCIHVKVVSHYFCFSLIWVKFFLGPNHWNQH